MSAVSSLIFNNLSSLGLNPFGLIDSVVKYVLALYVPARIPVGATIKMCFWYLRYSNFTASLFPVPPAPSKIIASGILSIKNVNAIIYEYFWS